MQHTPARMRACRNCGGFSTVAITTGTRNPDGMRTTLPMACPTCHGHAPARNVTTPAPACAGQGR